MDCILRTFVEFVQLFERNKSGFRKLVEGRKTEAGTWATLLYSYRDTLAFPAKSPNF